MIVGGTFDSPLSGVALLELGKLAMAAGDAKAAGQLFLDASVSGVCVRRSGCGDGVAAVGVGEFFGGGRAAVLYGPLEPAAAWAQANRLWHVAATLRLAQAENLLRGGQVQEAAAIVEEIGRRLGEMRAARLGMQQLFLQAVVQVGRGQVDPASASLSEGARRGSGWRRCGIFRLCGRRSCTTRGT